MSTEFPFSKRRIDELAPPVTGRDQYRDSKLRGLVLRVTCKGAKSFTLYKKVKGRPVRLTLGKFPAVTVEQARRSAARLLAELADGKDPAAARRAARREATLADLFEHWMQFHARPHKKTFAEDERQFNVFLKPWAGRKLSSIRKSDVRNLHARIGRKNGPYAANRLLALLRAMFNKATALGFTRENPTAGIKKFPETKRDRFLHAHELRAFFQSLAAEHNTVLRDYFLVSLLTGARKGNVLGMRWADIDFDARFWHIPNTKSGHPVVVPLTGPVLTVLEARRNAANGSPWVFPGRGKTGHLADPKSAWKRIIRRAALTDVRPHDLRRSLGSWMAMTGAGLPVVGKMLGHTEASTTQIYARLSVDPVREAAEKATAAMLEAGGLNERTELTEDRHNP